MPKHKRLWELHWIGLSVAGSLIWWQMVPIDSVRAQIVPDATLGAESSQVIRGQQIRGMISDRIEGGATRGANLFHSFQEFNVGAGRGAYFANPTGIENILTRVTGGNPSEIMGRLGVLGGG